LSAKRDCVAFSNQLQRHVPTGCPACHSVPPFVVLRGDKPEPPESCPACGRVYPYLRVIRIRRVEQGPQ
jgi:hypothetical protein